MRQHPSTQWYDEQALTRHECPPPPPPDTLLQPLLAEYANIANELHQERFTSAQLRQRIDDANRNLADADSTLSQTINEHNETKAQLRKAQRHRDDLQAKISAARQAANKIDEAIRETAGIKEFFSHFDALKAALNDTKAQ